MVPNYFPLDDYSQAMYVSYDGNANSEVPKGYYHVRKLLNGCFENESYDEIDAVSSDLKEVEPYAFHDMESISSKISQCVQFNMARHGGQHHLQDNNRACALSY